MYGPVHRPVRGNPYAGSRQARSRPLLVAGAVLIALLLVGGGVFLVTRGDGDGGDGAEAARTPSPHASGTAEGDAKPARPEPSASAPDHWAKDVNGERKPGEAKVWRALNTGAVPGNGASLHDVWTVGGTLVQAGYKDITAYRVADGSVAWSVEAPAKICDTPVNPTPDGKVVIAYKAGTSENAKCNQLQMIDLRTGDKGWHKELTEHSIMDSTLIVHLAISKDTVLVGQNMMAYAYRVSDGKHLFTSKKEFKGSCYPEDVAGGARLLEIDSCGVSAPKPFSQLKELDPETGRVKWRYVGKKGVSISKVYSVDPVVVTLKDREDMDHWTVVALDDRGKLRSRLKFGSHVFEECEGSGDSGRGAQNCSGAAVGADRFYLSTEPKDGSLGANRIVAFDLGSGKVKWASGSGSYQLQPLRAEGSGKKAKVVTYARAATGKAGRTVRFGPRGGEPEVLLKHPAAAAKVESGMFAATTLYRDGRFFVAPSRLDGNSYDDEPERSRLLSVGR
ncbi:PQQ-binding-like beta-propeller repeat protein [Streptomyces sp. NPDC059009]|uniref:outer membrane protein assembly factor BamB family protein n=1 Tax=Streptomyces sp. NPDC059009 TaxID=3346694 RepID=UPI0036A5E679